VKTTCETKRLTLGRVLVVEDCAPMARALAATVARCGWEVRIEGTRDAACEALRDGIDAMLLDLGLPDGSGVDVAHVARYGRPAFPILIVTGSHETVDINRASVARIDYACKPVSDEVIAAFLERCETSYRKMLNDLAAQFGLSEAHMRLIHAAATTSSGYKKLSDELGRSVNTVKTEVREILRRTRAKSLEDVVVPLRACLGPRK
jgi:DNA-binding response OmpR family regulator